VRGAWWQTFGTVLLAVLLGGILTLVANALVAALAGVVVSSSQLGERAFIVTGFEQLVSIVAVVPFTCAISTVIAVDLRVRKEGLDLELLTGTTGGTAPELGFLPRPRAQLAPGATPPSWPPAAPPPPPAAPPDEDLGSTAT